MLRIGPGTHTEDFAPDQFHHFIEWPGEVVLDGVFRGGFSQKILYRFFIVVGVRLHGQFISGMSPGYGKLELIHVKYVTYLHF